MLFEKSHFIFRINTLLANSPRNIFLVDSIGAVISATLLAIIAQLHHYFGMPQAVLYKLILLPVLYALYSLLCFVIQPTNWQLFLKIIALANLIYCIITVCLTIQYFTVLTLLGRVYFLSEAAVIVILFVIEWAFSCKSK